jgi:tetratricopeptide (TPR) repeat protein
MNAPVSPPPLVSILIRSMDRPTLTRALDSAAAQTWPHLEIVVAAANGLAHRPLPETWKGRPLRLVRAQPNARLPRPRAANLCLESARGEWLNFLDDDDELLPHHLGTLLAAPRAQGERVVFSRTRVVDAQGRTLGHVSHAGNHVQLYFHSRATTCALLLHRSLVDEGARFDTDFDVHEDHDFQVNCATRSAFRYVDEATCLWHAQAGDSGCGFGANDDGVRRGQSVAKIRQKWAEPLRRWLTDADAVLFAGQQYLHGGDYAAASACFEQALHLRPHDINALNLGGMANLRAGRLDRAEQLFTQALRRLPDHPGLRANLDLLRRTRAAQQQ